VSENEPFLSRWSRLKQETAKGVPEPAAEAAPPADAAATGEDAPAPAAVPADNATASEAFDPASLPPLESIGAGSDIRAFLARGVPAELTRAALRRAWAADPAIRDFIGLSENSWDFTAPDGVPGFGPMRATDDVRELLAQVGRQGSQVNVAEGAGSSDTRPPSPDSETTHSQGEMSAGAHSDELAQGGPHEPVKGAEEPQEGASPSHVRQRANIDHKNEDVAPQNLNKHSELSGNNRPRGHGGALPR
jgi:Protein of unknown function (DUF3306)